MHHCYLDLFEWHFETEGLIVVGVQGVLFDCRLFLLQTFAILHQMDLHVRVCKTTQKWHLNDEFLLDPICP